MTTDQNDNQNQTLFQKHREIMERIKAKQKDKVR